MKTSTDYIIDMRKFNTHHNIKSSLHTDKDQLQLIADEEELLINENEAKGIPIVFKKQFDGSMKQVDIATARKELADFKEKFFLS